MSFGRSVLVLASASAFLGGEARAETIDCRAPGADCTLREAAAQAGFFVGAAEGPLGSEPAFDQALAAEFNSLTTENALKWGPLTDGPGSYDFTRADAAIDFAEANDMRARGHTLLWGRLNGPPSWLQNELDAAQDPAARMQELMEEHIQTVVSRYAGRIDVWDVVNEPLALFTPNQDPDNPFFQTLGPGYIADAFHLARAADPNALLFLNETNTEFFDLKFAGLRNLVADLLAQGVPIDGVGLQAHFVAGPNPETLQQRIQALADLGVLVELTEVDIPIGLYANEPDPFAAQAAAYADVFAACLAVDACTGITVWGVDDGHTWLDGFFPDLAPNLPLLLDPDYARKPAWTAARDALLAEIPEPGTAALLAAGLAVLAAGPRSVEKVGSRARASSRR